MACRCSEISRCERDIELITGEVARKLNSAQNSNELIMAKASSFISFLSDAVFVENSDRATQRLASIKKQHDSLISNLQSRRSSELSRLKSRLESYKNEDRRYHEMMAQKAHR